jgi:competence protein ComFC
MSDQILDKLLGPLLDLLFPPKCEVCGKLGRPAFCNECREEILFTVAPLCEVCGTMVPPAAAERGRCPDCAQEKRYFDAARSVGVHHGSLRRAILNYKFNNARRLEGPLGKLLADRLAGDAVSPCPMPSGELHGILPIPLHPTRRAWRGFDQALHLCRKLGNLMDLPVVEGLLLRVKPTRPQVDLTPEQRRENVRGAFAVQGTPLEGRNVLLVDDVYTTGATANRAAQACRQGGAAGVYVLTLSRPAPPWHPAALSLEPGEAREGDQEQQQTGN